MKAVIVMALLVMLDCVTFGANLRYHFVEKLASYNVTQASEAAAVWGHDRDQVRNQYNTLLDALTVKK